MAWTTLWVFLLAGLISPLVTEQMFTVDYETTDGEDSSDDTEDDDAGEDEDTDGDYGDVFEDYFDDEMRVVDVDQDVAIEACVTNSDSLVKKIDKAYNKCFKDFEDWNEFQKNNDGNDQDKDGLSDEYEADEACFYKRMGWVVNNKADKEAIKKDFENLNLNNVKNDFVSSIDACSSWNGKFVGRKKRDAEDSWALSLARERREAARNRDGKKPRNGGRNKPRRGNRRGQRNNKADKKDGKGKKVNKNGNGKGKKNGARRNRRRKKNNKDARKERKGKKGNKNRNGNGNSKSKGRRRNRTNNKKNKNKNKNKNKDKENKDKKDKKENKKGRTSGLTRMEKQTIKQLLPETVYNQLWCYELSVEKALENCVKEKILP